MIDIVPIYDKFNWYVFTIYTYHIPIYHSMQSLTGPSTFRRRSLLVLDQETFGSLVFLDGVGMCIYIYTYMIITYIVKPKCMAIIFKGLLYIYIWFFKWCSIFFLGMASQRYKSTPAAKTREQMVWKQLYTYSLYTARNSTTGTKQKSVINFKD